MQAELKKMAAHLRKIAAEQKQAKLVKCAQIAQALIGLTILRRKIG